MNSVNTQLVRTNFRSKGFTPKFTVVEKATIGEFLSVDSETFSAVKRLKNEKLTPYVWVKDGAEEGSAQVFFSKAAADLLATTGGKLSRSKHSLETRQSIENEDEVYYLITTTEEVVGVTEYAD